MGLSEICTLVLQRTVPASLHITGMLKHPSSAQVGTHYARIGRGAAKAQVGPRLLLPYQLYKYDIHLKEHTGRAQRWNKQLVPWVPEVGRLVMVAVIFGAPP